MDERIKAAVTKVRHYLQGDGGDLELVELKSDGTLVLRLLAPLGESDYLRAFTPDIERMLRQDVPELARIELL
ncbi:MAG: hypothetical protein A2284_11705 [Deltaproteobacteria bacterium RIFOXYA12_FULL_61_11]|nr:MAG: hypothetical protein A2284_11705 [Deltaproteobacteria bacterium RIFOXYA12_FULL_61_11]